MNGLYDIACEARGDEELHALVGICGGETRSAPVSGIKALMLAILQDGIQAFLGKQARARTEAEVWIMSRHRTVFSFVTVCECLGLEPDWVRGVLVRLRERNVSPRTIGRLRPNVRRAQRMCKPRRRAA
jgi:hypothetical protein